MEHVTALTAPTLDLYDSWAAAWDEFGGRHIDGSGIWKLDDGRLLGSSREECEQLVAKTREMAYLAHGGQDGRVRSDYYWITAKAEVVGFLALRHELGTDFLRNVGGHIGYSVRPSRRREGHASRALGLALERARQIGLDRVLITCTEDNTASARTAESQGGVLEAVVDGSAYGYGRMRRYWITL